MPKWVLMRTALSGGGGPLNATWHWGDLWALGVSEEESDARAVGRFSGEAFDELGSFDEEQCCVDEDVYVFRRIVDQPVPEVNRD
jgi:hypothetical protein